ncbi:MAG: hypothetical protein WKG07_35415 [Hymenobacter sp.]
MLIVGDVMVDAYVWGRASRLSPEAPVPVVNVDRTENRLGGAANVALNVQALGATPCCAPWWAMTLAVTSCSSCCTSAAYPPRALSVARTGLPPTSSASWPTASSSCALIRR